MLGYNYRLLSTGEGATYANAKQDEERLYQNTIIPQAEALMEQYNAGLHTPEANIEICMSYEHVAILQQSEKEKGDGRLAMDNALEKEYKNGLITKNMWLEKLGEDTVANGLFDKYIFELTPEERGMIIIDNQNQNNDGSQGQTESGQSSSGGQ